MATELVELGQPNGNGRNGKALRCFDAADKARTAERILVVQRERIRRPTESARSIVKGLEAAAALLREAGASAPSGGEALIRAAAGVKAVADEYARLRTHSRILKSELHSSHVDDAANLVRDALAGVRKACM